MRLRRRCRIVVLVALVLATSGCVVPARSDGHYRADAAAAVESAASEVGTALLVLMQLDDDRITGQSADVLVTEAEEALGPVQDSFASVQPPSVAVDSLRAEVTSALGDAQDALSAARIAVRRDDPAARHTAREDLQTVSDLLDELDEKLA